MVSPTEPTNAEKTTASTTELLPTIQKIDLAKYSLTRLTDLIKFADQKALFLLAVLSFIFGHLINKLTQLKWEELNTITIVTLSFAIFSGLLAVIFALKVVYPRLTRKEVKKGFLYWANVLQYSSFDEFKQGFDNFSMEEVLRNFSEQLYLVARINESKYRDLKNSFVAATISVIFHVAFFLIK